MDKEWDFGTTRHQEVMIPFGKYQGQPVSVLQNDPRYASWLSQQEWAKQKFPHVVNVIINRFGNDEETPEHNAMQSKFMNKGYCAAVASLLGKIAINDCSKAISWFSNKVNRGPYQDLDSSTKWKKATFRVSKKTQKLSDLIDSIKFEVNAIYVYFEVYSDYLVVLESGSGSWKKEWFGLESINPKKVKLEIKPKVGDDYPAIIRQMRNSNSNCLFYASYSGVGVNENSFIEFFKSQGFSICSEEALTCNFREYCQEILAKIKEFEDCLIRNCIDIAQSNGIEVATE